MCERKHSYSDFPPHSSHEEQEDPGHLGATPRGVEGLESCMGSLKPEYWATILFYSILTHIEAETARVMRPFHCRSDYLGGEMGTVMNKIEDECGRRAGACGFVTVWAEDNVRRSDSQDDCPSALDSRPLHSSFFHPHRLDCL